MDEKAMLKEAVTLLRDLREGKQDWEDRRSELFAEYGKLTRAREKVATSPEFVGQYQRLRDALGTRTQVELADKLHIRQSSISDAQRRKTLPSSWVETAYLKYGIDPAWIRRGLGQTDITVVEGEK